MSRTTVVIDDDLQEKAKDLGINISEVCREGLRTAVVAKKEAARHGDEYETITADIWHDRHGDEMEAVQFVGRLVHYEEKSDTNYYLTAGGVPSVVTEEGQLMYGEELWGEVPGHIRQLLEEAIGEAPTPTVLDI